MTGFKKKYALTFLPSLDWAKAWALGESLCLSLLGPSTMSQSDRAPERPLLIHWQRWDLPYGI